MPFSDRFLNSFWRLPGSAKFAKETCVIADANGFIMTSVGSRVLGDHSASGQCIETQDRPPRREDDSVAIESMRFSDRLSVAVARGLALLGLLTSSILCAMKQCYEAGRETQQEDTTEYDAVNHGPKVRITHGQPSRFFIKAFLGRSVSNLLRRII